MSIVLDAVFEHLRVARNSLAVSLFNDLNAQGRSRALEGWRVNSNSPTNVGDRDKGVAGRNGRE